MTLRSRVLLEKLIALLLNKFPAHYKALRFITAKMNPTHTLLPDFLLDSFYNPVHICTNFPYFRPSESKYVRICRLSHAFHDPHPHRYSCSDHFKFGTACQEGITKSRGIGPLIFNLIVVTVSFTPQLLFSPRCALSRMLNVLQSRSRNFGERTIPCHFQDLNHDSPDTQAVVSTKHPSRLQSKSHEE